MSKYKILFVTILISFFFTYAVTADISSNASVKNEEYSNYLTTATHDAAKQMKIFVDDGVAMPNQTDRENVRDAFFKSLAKDFGYVSEQDMERLHLYVPALLMIDTNGYYVVYNQLEGEQIRQVLSSLNTWTKSAKENGYSFDIQYFLGNRIKLTLGLLEGESTSYLSYDGEYYNVVENVEKDLKNKGKEEADVSTVLNTLSSYGIRKHITDASEIGASEQADVADALGNVEVSVSSVNKARDTLLQTYRNSFIIPELEEKVNYYINANNDAAAADEEMATGYIFTMPDTTEEDWTRLVKNPTVIGFLQGIRVSNGSEFLNIYAMSSGEISKSNATTFTDSEDGQRTYYASGSFTNGSANGYVPGNGSANGAEVTTPDNQNTDDIYVHHHWGDSSLGTGCYTLPVKHIHTTSCYDAAMHHHADKNGNQTAILSDDGEKIETEAVSVELGGSGCYNTPIFHKHTEECYTKIFHHHTGSPTTGGGCYTVPIYHVHTASCYSEGKDETYQPKKNIYHEHKDPVFYYRKVGDDSGKEYSDSEVAADSNEKYYIIRADATGNTCYSKIVYARRKYTVTGKKTCTLTKIYDAISDTSLKDATFKVLYAGKYKISAGETTVELNLKENDKLQLTFGDNDSKVIFSNATSLSEILSKDKREKVTISLAKSQEYVWEETKYDPNWAEGKKLHFTEKIDNDSYWTYDGIIELSSEQDKVIETDGNGKNLVLEGYTYQEMEKTCGKTTSDVEKTYYYGDAITSHKKGELICGMTESTVLGYTTGCGMIDTSDPDSQEMKDYKDGLLDYNYILSKAVERIELICGMDETKIQGYSLSCGKKEGQTVYTLKSSESGRENVIDHYELGCGLEDGERISFEQYKKEESEKNEE